MYMSLVNEIIPIGDLLTFKIYVDLVGRIILIKSLLISSSKDQNLDKCII